MKKVLALVLSLTLVLTVMSGCKKNDDITEGATGDDLKILWAGTTRDPIEGDNDTEKYLEEKFGVEITSIQANQDKIAGQVATGTIPDVMFVFEPENWQALADQDVIREVPIDMIKKYAPKQYKAIVDTNEGIWGITTYKDKNMAVPKLAGNEYNTVAIWRQDWLDAAGITKVPETIEEYETAFLKFKELNVDKVTTGAYGLSGQGSHSARQFDEIFGAFGVMPGQWLVENDKVINGTISDKSKEALTLLNKWYNLGIIDPEFLTDDPTSMGEKFKAGRVGYSHSGVSNIMESTATGKTNLAQWAERKPEAKLVAAPLLKGPNGDQGDWLWGPRGNFVVFGADCSDVKMAKILSMLDEIFNNEELAIRCVWGIEGETFEYNDKAAGPSAGLRYISPYDTDVDARAKKGIGQNGFYNMFQTVAGWANQDILEKYQPKDYIEKSEEIAHLNKSQDALFRPFLPSAAQVTETLNTLKTTEYSAFITGKRSLNEWDKFVEQWKTSGGEQLTKEAQEFYNTSIKQFVK